MKRVELMFIALASIAGCATVNAPASDSLSQKLISDAQAVQSIANDVKTKCGPEFAPLGPVVMAALQIAATPQDVLNDVMAVVQAAPALYKDGQAIACAIRTVLDDLKALKPKPATTAYYQLEMARQVLALLDAPAPALALCAAR